MAKEKEKIRYFITQNKQGQELSHIQWSRKINTIMAMAHPSGAYISAIPEVWELLEVQGYLEVEKEYLENVLKIENPVPDRIDYTIHEDRVRYAPYE